MDTVAGISNLPELSRRSLPVEVFPGKDEMQSLVEGAFRALNNQERAKNYEDEVKL